MPTIKLSTLVCVFSSFISSIYKYCSPLVFCYFFPLNTFSKDFLFNIFSLSCCVWCEAGLQPSLFLWQVNCPGMPAPAPVCVIRPLLWVCDSFPLSVVCALNQVCVLLQVAGKNPW